MRSPWTAGTVAVLVALAVTHPAPAQAPALQWIWTDEAKPAGTRHFRKTFRVDRPVDEAAVDIAADRSFRLSVNGKPVGTGDDWKTVKHFDVTRHFVVGTNVVAVEATAAGDRPAGLLARISFVPNGLTRSSIITDATWNAAGDAPEGWERPDFDDARWAAAKVIGPYGKPGPWAGQTWEAGGDDRFRVPPGFRVEEVIPPPTDDAKFSLINLCFDARGRLFLSRERGSVLLVGGPDRDGRYAGVSPFCTQVTSAQGMCWVGDALYLSGEGPAGVGVYRCRDTKGADRIDEVTLVHKFREGMSEHGPHALVHGPDDHLYLVLGNHAFADIGPEAAKNGANPARISPDSPLLRWPTGQPGPDQGKPNTTEDVLLPRLNDARGHAADKLAPGGTVWRLDPTGKRMALVAAGFRNHYDAAFTPAGELFTFDSDMEWDEGLPWYRPVRLCHCPPGADFLWRTGAANTPSYYPDSLPPTLETGRGSPTGVEVYDHTAFPSRYRGALFLGDWSVGVIHAVTLERDGATWKASAEKFCSGMPLNVTDLVTGPDGALYFTLGGRDAPGGIYRIVADRPGRARPDSVAGLAPQPLSAWGRARLAAAIRAGKLGGLDLRAVAFESRPGKTAPTDERLRALDLLGRHGPRPETRELAGLLKDRDAEVRAYAVLLLGRAAASGAFESQVRSLADDLARYADVLPAAKAGELVAGLRRDRQEAIQGTAEALVAALADEDALVRRRACEALLHAGIEPPVEKLLPLLDSTDRVLRTAARLVLQRLEAKRWVNEVVSHPSERVAAEGVIALAKSGQLAPHAEVVFGRLRGRPDTADAELYLAHLRALQLALTHTERRPIWVRAIGERCFNEFPHRDLRVNRELAVVLTHLRRDGQITRPVHEKLLAALKSPTSDRAQQIHYFYCLRLLHEGWTPAQKAELLAWFDATKGWGGGHSFVPFLENILRDLNPAFTPEDRSAALAREDQPWAAAAVLRLAADKDLPPPAALLGLHERLAKASEDRRAGEQREGLIDALARHLSPEASAALRKVGDTDRAVAVAVARALARRKPAAEDLPYLVRGLEATPPPLHALELVQALKANPGRPKADDPAPFRAVLTAAVRLPAKNRWEAVELLRAWTGGRQFGSDEGDWKGELPSWGKWFTQAFPKEPALPDLAAADRPAESKWKYEELLALVGPSATLQGDPARGKAVFAKAACAKCHKYGTEGEGVGPDLSAVAKRFPRAYILESIVHPSKAISDQYRSSLVVTKKGQTYIGLVGVKGDTVTVVLQDATRATLKKDEVEQQFASLVSVMPERLLDELTKEEVVDLFAFLESAPSGTPGK